MDVMCLQNLKDLNMIWNWLGFFYKKQSLKQQFTQNIKCCNIFYDLLKILVLNFLSLSSLIMAMTT